jgi:hypothetical protein
MMEPGSPCSLAIVLLAPSRSRRRRRGSGRRGNSSPVRQLIYTGEHSRRLIVFPDVTQVQHVQLSQCLAGPLNGVGQFLEQVLQFGGIAGANRPL